MEENKKKDNKPKLNINSWWIYGLLILVLIGYQVSSYFSNVGTEISSSEFFRKAEDGDIKEILIVNKKDGYAKLTKKALAEYDDNAKPGIAGGTYQYSFEIGAIENFGNRIDEINNELGPQNGIEVRYESRKNWLGEIGYFLIPLLLLVFLWMFILRRMGGGGAGPGAQIFNIGKSKARLLDGDSKVNVTFEDVAGLDEAKEEVIEVVDFLKSPTKYTALGGKIPKGVILVGPPGTGKTLLAKAVAGEAKVPFFSLSGSDFVEMFVGVGASRVRDLFRQAREKAPCIVFIDEIDAIGRARGKNNMQGGNDERENTLNQLLVEMDGFASDSGVILMAATNRPDVLDNALLRPGRFDRQIAIGLPDLAGREAIFKVHLKNIKINESIKPMVLAEMTPGFAGADIANVCNEAALIAARRGKNQVDMDDFNFALDRVIGGLEKKNKLISPEEKEVIAYHEAGHAICGWFLEHASPLVKVTIVPRGVGTLGYAQYLPKEEYITRTEQLLDRMCMTFGGRAAERIVFDKISTGAQSDLDQVTKMAYSMVTVYGMNEKVGNVSFYGIQNDSFHKPYSEETAAMIDEQVRVLVESQYDRAIALLKKHRKELNALAEALLEREVIVKSDLEELIGRRPFPEPQKPSSLLAQHVDKEEEKTSGNTNELGDKEESPQEVDAD